MPLQTRWEKIVRQDMEELKKQPELISAAQLLRQGGLVAFPTETVYGLGANATDQAAVARIFTAKGRPSDNPLIIHIGNKEQLGEWVTEVPPLALRLLEYFSPGPLTLVLPHRGNLANNVTAGLPTVAVRIPDHPVALALLQLVNLPVAAPSANRSGRPSPTEAKHVWEDLAGKIEMVVDGGATGVGVESTVVDVTGEIPILLRPGGISLEQLRQVIGEVHVDPGLVHEHTAPRSPGMKYRHYAPRAEMWLVQGEGVQQYIQRRTQEAQAAGKRVGILTTREHQDRFHADVVLACGERSDPSSVARNLYHTLRQFDEAQVDLILSETFPESGLTYSVMDRLRKAADGRVVEV